MKKRTLMVVGLVLTMSLLAAGSAFARWAGYGMMGSGYGMMDYYGSRYDRDVDVQELRKFQKETLQLRDELIAQRAELEQEYAKSDPDADRIAQLRKGIIDTETKIGKVAEKYDFPAYGRRGGSRGGNRGYNCAGPGGCF
jgi:zinc resistance-associated protein